MSHYPYTYSLPVAAPGWLCPRCNTVNAPTTPWCYRCATPGAQVAKDTTGVNPTEHKPTTTSAGGAKDMDRW